jgi:hypothetical protein
VFSVDNTGTTPVTVNVGGSSSTIGSGSTQTVATDTTPPTVNCASAPTFVLGATDTLTASVGDDGSGPAAATVSAAANTSSVGQKSASLTGYDKAGNPAAASCAYKVVYRFSGFLSPVDNPNVVNAGKAGKTYPVKWQLENAGGSLIGSADLSKTKVTVKSTDCSAFTGNPGDALEATSTGLTSLRYDSTANQYIYNWAAPSAKGCYTLFLTLDDTTVHTAYFNLS